MIIKTLQTFIILSLSLQIFAQDCVINTCANADLSWQDNYKDQIILEFTNPPIQPCGASDGNILQCSYKGEPVFVFKTTILPCDVGYTVFDCEGNTLFGYGGFCEEPCYPPGEDPSLIIDCIETFNWETGNVSFCPCIDLTIPITSDVVCPQVVDPVCGCDGQTYNNSCEAMYYHGVTSWTDGACEDECIPIACVNGDLSWQDNYKNQIILEFTNPPIEPCGASDGNILQCSYKGEPVYVFKTTILPCDVGYTVFDCEGNNLFGYGGFCDGPCYPPGEDPSLIIECIETFNWQTGDVDLCPCIDPSIPYTVDIYCPAVIDPVCGCDAKTYNNSCEAMYYYGVTSWTDGPCSDICVPVVCENADLSWLEDSKDQISLEFTNPPFSPCSGSSGAIQQCIYKGNPVYVFTPTILPCDVGTVVYDCYGNSIFEFGGLCGNMCLPPGEDPALLIECLEIFNYQEGTHPYCEPTCVDPDQIDLNVGCPDNWDPICGCDNVTYSNVCDAFYHGGITIWTNGECPPCIDSTQMDMPPPCLNTYEPVCGCDGNDYQNWCAAFVSGVVTWEDGRCDPSICIDSSLMYLGIPCTEEYEPVCGCDGNTYSNKCVAFTSGVASWTAGPCQGECIDPSQINLNVACPENYDPVCGCDNITYSNICHAFNYGGVASWTSGECIACIDSTQMDMPPPCINIYEPVCGCDGNDYVNWCEAYVNGVVTWEDGRCDSGICIDSTLMYLGMPCTAEWDPVCGCDGNTYSNDCVALTSGVTSWRLGECDCLDTVHVDADPIHGIYESRMRTYSSSKIESSQSAIFQSNGQIDLEPGFEVESNATFVAEIDACDVNHNWTLGDETNGAGYATLINVSSSSQLHIWIEPEVSLCANNAVRLRIMNNTSGQQICDELIEIVDANGIPLEPFMKSFDISQNSEIGITTGLEPSMIPGNSQINCFWLGNISFGIEY